MTNKSTNKRHRYALDYTNKQRPDSKQGLTVTQCTQDLCNPFSFVDRQINDVDIREASNDLIVKKSWDVALAPVKQLPMNLFIMWMSGNSISMFPIMMIGMMFMRPIQALMSSANTFKLIIGEQALIQKICYVLGNLLGLGLAVYKCHCMGLLPTHSSDWLAFVEPQSRVEYSNGGFIL